MDKVQEFQKLEAEWQLAKAATTEAQLAVDLKMNAFLAGVGQAPTRKEMLRVDDLRHVECEKRGALDDFISEWAEQ